MRKWSGSARRWAGLAVSKCICWIGHFSKIKVYFGSGPFESHIHCGDLVVALPKKMLWSRETQSNRAGIGFAMRWEKMSASSVPNWKLSALHVQSPSPILQGEFFPNISFLPFCISSHFSPIMFFVWLCSFPMEVISIPYFHFGRNTFTSVPKCARDGPRLSSGRVGWSCLCLKLLFQPQPATVRKSLHNEVPMATPVGRAAIFPKCIAKGSRFTLWVCGSGGGDVFPARCFGVRSMFVSVSIFICIFISISSSISMPISVSIKIYPYIYL